MFFMLMKMSIFFLLVCFGRLSYSQPPTIDWTHCYGGTDLDYFLSIIQTSDNGYIATGYAQSSDGDISSPYGNADLWVVKTDIDGAILWKSNYGGTSDETGNCIIQTQDGGYAVAGMTWSKDGDIRNNHGKGDFWVLKLSASGKIEWQKTYGGSEDDEASSIVQMPDGGYLVTGYTYSNDGDVTGLHSGGFGDIWLIRIDPNGNLLWQKTYGGSRNDVAYSIISTTDGNYMIGGISESSDGDATDNHGKADYWLIKINSVGKILWQKTYGGSKDEFLASVIETADKGFALNGYSFSNDGDVSGNHGDADFWIVKVDNSGELQWEKALGGSDREKGMAIRQMPDGGFVAIGCARSINGDVTGIHGDEDAWVVKLCSSGSIEWEKCFGGSQGEEALSLVITTKGEYVFAGDAASINADVTGLHGKPGMSDAWIVKLQPLAGSTLSTYMKSEYYNVKPSDTVKIPLYANNYSTNNSSLGSSLDLIYSFNTDLLTPLMFIPDSKEITSDPITVNNNSVKVTLHFSPSYIFSGETEIGKLYAIANVADTLESDVRLAGAINSSTCLASPIDSVSHVKVSGCGVRTLSEFLRGELPTLMISPTPAQNRIVAKLSRKVLFHYEVFDVLGITRKRGDIEGNSFDLDASDMMTGNYYLRGITSSGVICTVPFIIAK
jgi:hypothetical protein